MVLKTKPGAAVFLQYMVFGLPYISNRKAIGKLRKDSINGDNRCKNADRVDFDYAIRQKVLLQQEGILCKAQTPFLGLYLITQVHTNSTIRI